MQKQKTMTTTIYTPESQLRSIKSLASAMWRDLLASRELAWRLTVRDIKSRYRQSLLGVLWAFIPPVVTTLVFVILNQEGAMNIGKTEIPYPAFVMIGTVLWQLFVDSLNAPLKIVSSNKTMLVKINFPREALILSAIAQTMFDYLIRLIIIAFVFILYQIPLTWGLPLAIVGSIMIMVLGIMIGLLITPLGILYTDVNSTLTTVISMWFFATPVVYPPPQRWPYSLLINLNPISPLLVGTRDLLINGTLSNPLPFIAVSFLAFLFLLMMWVFYRISIPILAERMSA